MKQKGAYIAAVCTCLLLTGALFINRLTDRSTSGTRARVNLLTQVVDHVRKDYVDTLSDSVIYRHALVGAVNQLHDPFSTFLEPTRLTNLEERTQGHYAGVGIQMDVRDSGITVIGVLPDTPAEHEGVFVGDRILTIDEKSIHGLTSEEALRKLRGPAKTEVRLSIERSGIPDPLSFTLVRREIEVNPVPHAFLIADKVGYVDLTIFSAAAAKDLTVAIDSLRAAGARSLIFDLRSDPGGLLDQGVSVADLFLDAGQTVVSTRGRQPDETSIFTDRAAQRWPEMPVIVLTDSMSASASEIVAGALQDHDRAIIVGTTTFGKGSAQRVYKFNGGAVKLTTALWYTPSGRSINRPHPAARDDDTPISADTGLRPKFKTDRGRVVVGGGGIVPDLIVPQRTQTDAEKMLQSTLGKNVQKFRDVIAQYALGFRKAGAEVTPGFDVTPAMRDELYRRAGLRGIQVPRPVYDSARAMVSRALGAQITRFTLGARAEFIRSLRDDPTAIRAVALAQGITTQQQLFDRVSAPHRN